MQIKWDDDEPEDLDNIESPIVARIYLGFGFAIYLHADETEELKVDYEDEAKLFYSVKKYTDDGFPIFDIKEDDEE